MRSFCELCPSLIETTGKYILSEVFCQDPLERYFSRMRHRGGSNENPTVEQFRTNSQLLVQQQQVGHQLSTMNVLPAQANDSCTAHCQPLPKRQRKKL